MLTLSNHQARQLLVRYHNLDGRDGLRGIDGVRAIMDRLGTVQFDPLNVAGRNADLALQARVRGYRPDMLRRLLYEERYLVDGYDKEMCVYTARDFGAFAPQRALHAADARNWLTGRGQGEAFDMLEDILAAIRERGPLSLTDIPIGESKDFGWGPRRPSGAAIEYLFRAGRLCIADKAGTQRRFDLTERVLPPECMEAPARDDAAFADWYVQRRVRCVGLLWGRKGSAWQGYVVSGDAGRRAALERLCGDGRLVPLRIEGIRDTFYAPPEAPDMLEDAGSAPRMRFIAPLDNLMWDRAMVEALFAAFPFTKDFDSIVGGDSAPRAKPDPDPIWMAVKECGTTPSRTLYVGDLKSDIVAARNAGVASCAVKWGYGSFTGEPLEEWGAQYEAQSPSDVLKIARGQP